MAHHPVIKAAVIKAAVTKAAVTKAAVVKAAMKTIALLCLLPLAAVCQTRGTSVGNSNLTSDVVSSVTLPPWNVAAGGTIVGCARYANSLTATISVSDSGSANRFTVTNYADVGTNTRIAMFKAENTKAVLGDVLKIQFSSQVAYTSEAAVQYSGTAASAYDAGATASTTGTTVVSSPFSTSQGPEVVVACGSYADTTVKVAGLAGTAQMSIAAVDSPNNVLAIEDANLYQIQTGITASMSNVGTQTWGFIVGTFKSASTVSPPILSQTFSQAGRSVGGVAYIYAGSPATVSFTITNTNASSSLSGIAFSNTLPQGMTVASPSGLTGSCPDGTVDAVDGGGTISLSGATLAPAGACNFSLNIMSNTVGAGVNTTGNITSLENSHGGNASATLAVYGLPAMSISNIEVKAVDHASVNLTYSTGTTGYCQLQYGVESGRYIYSGGSARTFVNGCQLSIGGLAPGTTYYVMPTVRPNANDTTGLCQVGGSCGSVEQSFTTLPLPGIHPAPPVPPAVWTPVEPDTGNYTIVPMRASAADGTCVAAANVARQPRWKADIQANDSLQTVVGKIWFDTVIEFPEGQQCSIPQTDPYFHTGVVLPQYSPAGGPNDWVVMRTRAASASSLPPAGVRTGPQFASHLATLVAQVPGMPMSPESGGAQNFNGQIFDCYASGCNHFWIENLGMTHAFNTTLYPPGATDPPAFVNYVRFVPSCMNVPLAQCTIESPDTTPSYMVLDRIYAFGQPWPSREMSCFVPGGNHWALINNYCTTNFWVEGVYPRSNPGSTGATLTIPYSYFQFNAFDKNPIGMTIPAGYAGTSASSLTMATGPQRLTTQAGLSYTVGSPIEIMTAQNENIHMMGTVTGYDGTTLLANIAYVAGYGTYSAWNLAVPAVANFTVPADYTGAVVAWLGSSGLTIDYQGAPGVSLSCTGCTAKSEPLPSRLTSVPSTSMYFFNGHFANGSFVLDISTPWNASPSIFTADRPIGIYLYPGQYGVYDNNYMQAIGQSIYNDAYGRFEDLWWTHNYFYFPRSKMQNSGRWDGYGYSFRNVLETKGQTRGAYIGNIIDGSASYENPGNAIYLAGSYLGPNSGGARDIRISNNIFKHLSSGFQTAGGGAAAPPDSPPAVRYEITNNLWLDLNRDLYNNGGGGLSSGAFSVYPMVSDINFSNNTIGLTRGNGPALIEFGGASTAATTVMGEGLLFSNNVALTSLGGLDAIISIDGGQNPAYSNFPTNPTVMASAPIPAPAGTWEKYLNSDFIHTGASITPSWSLKNNVVIGGQNNRGLAEGVWMDMTPAQITAGLQSLWPASDTTTKFPCSASDTHCSGGSTLAGRLRAIGWNPAMDLAGGNPNPYTIVPSVYNPGNLGANVTTVNQATGVVQGIRVDADSTSLQFNYVAPDTKACSIDTSPDGIAWTRTTDNGGGFSRSTKVDGLSAGTSYNYRLQCYFDQAAEYEFLPDQITSGKKATAGTAGAAGVDRKVYQAFTLPAGASRAVFTFTAANTAAVHQTCTASPCAVNLAAGSWLRTLTFKTGNSAVVGSPSTVTIDVP